ncbi:hypothetical protein M0805_006092 [Coniferiporia weirii]|nr:hypothetical protein M0805_006092 [Coniferiporia weirii]
MMSSSPSPENQARKPHRCRRCGELMKGHPRGACRIQVSDTPEGSPAPSTVTGTTPPATRPPPPGIRPIMPGTFDRNDRPSEVSVMPTPRTLRERIGPKIEVDDDNLPVRDASEFSGSIAAGMGIQAYNGRRRASAPVQAAPTMLVGSSASMILPEHSISQRQIRRDRVASEAPGPQGLRDSGRLADRLGGFAYDDFDERDDEDDDSDDSYGAAYPSAGAAYPSAGATVGRFRGERSPGSIFSLDDQSEAGTLRSQRSNTVSTVSSNHSTPFSEILRASGASPIYEVAGKYIPFIQRRARRNGVQINLLPLPELDEPPMRAAMRERDDYHRNAVAGPSRRVPRREPDDIPLAVRRSNDTVRHLYSRSPERTEADRAAHLMMPPHTNPQPEPYIAKTAPFAGTNAAVDPVLFETMKQVLQAADINSRRSTAHSQLFNVLFGVLLTIVTAFLCLFFTANSESK